MSIPIDSSYPLLDSCIAGIPYMCQEKSTPNCLYPCIVAFCLCVEPSLLARVCTFVMRVFLVPGSFHLPESAVQLLSTDLRVCLESAQTAFGGRSGRYRESPSTVHVLTSAAGRLIMANARSLWNSAGRRLHSLANMSFSWKGQFM
jgi:hypothetical protein